MVIDTSAVIAIVVKQPERRIFTDIIAADPSTAMSIMTFYEASVVAATKIGSPRGAQRMDDFVREMQIETVASTIEDALAAREAYFRYGRLLLLRARQNTKRAAAV